MRLNSRSVTRMRNTRERNIFVMTERRAMHQDIRPLNMLILNLMPTKIVTETQLLRKLSNTPLQVNVNLLQTASYIPQHIDSNHLESFYTTFDQIKDRKFDGILFRCTLANVKFEMNYWDELCTIMDGVRHTFIRHFICAGVCMRPVLFLWIQRYDMEEKLSGVYAHKVLKENVSYSGI